MTGKRTEPATEIDVAPIEDYIDAIKVRHPALDDEDGIRNLAHFNRLLDYHGKRLEADAGDTYSTDLYQKLYASASRARDALGIGKRADATPKPPTATPIRRERERATD